MAKHNTIHLKKGNQLTLTTDANTSGSYVYLGTPKTVGHIAASATALVGPFNEGRYYDIVSNTGNISYSMVCDGIYTKDAATNVSNFLTRVDALDDLPVPVSGVITLDSDKAYHFTRALDLLGSRLVGGDNTAIMGTSSETSSITSTGLGVGVALFTTTGTTPIFNISFKDIDTAFDINGGGTAAYDWFAFNLINIPNLGTVAAVDNWIYSNGAIRNCNGLILNGSSGTVGINNSLVTSDGVAGAVITVPTGTTVSRRIRFIYSSFVITGSSTGIDIDAGATVPTEAYILDTINFAGGGTYLAGLDHTSNDSLFVSCTNIVNTAVNGQMYMQDNSTATVVTLADTYYKVLGATTASADNSKYTETDNRLTNAAVIERKYLIQCNLSFTSTNGNVCKFGFNDSKLGSVRVPSQTSATANASGRAENLSMAYVVNHSIGDYIEIHAQNTSSTANIVVTDMNVVITEI